MFCLNVIGQKTYTDVNQADIHEIPSNICTEWDSDMQQLEAMSYYLPMKAPG